MVSQVLPIGNLEFLEHIAEISSPAAARRLLESSPDAISREIDTIRTAIADKNSLLLKEACHSLRGACYSIEVRRLADITRQMEDASADIENAKAFLKPLEKASNETITWWHDLIDKGTFKE